MSSPSRLDGAALRGEHAQQAVEEGGLPGAVRADEPDPLALARPRGSTPSRAMMPEKDLVISRASSTARHPTGSSVRAGAGASGSGVPTDPRGSRSVRAWARRLPCSTRPSGWRANWMARQAEQHVAPLGGDGEQVGDAGVAAQDPPDEGPLEHDGVDEGVGGAGERGPLDGAGPEGHHQHQPEQGGERGEVAGVVHVLLVEAQHRPAQAGDEPGDGEGRDPGAGRGDADRLGGHLAAAQGPEGAPHGPLADPDDGHGARGRRR